MYWTNCKSVATCDTFLSHCRTHHIWSIEMEWRKMVWGKSSLCKDNPTEEKETLLKGVCWRCTLHPGVSQGLLNHKPVVIVFVVWLQLGLNSYFLNFSFSSVKTFFSQIKWWVMTLMLHMTYVYSLFLCFPLFHTITWPREANIIIWSFMTSEFLQVWLFLFYNSTLSFLSTASIYSPSRSSNNRPIWTRVCKALWENKRTGSSEYQGGLLWFAHIRHWYGLMGPSIKGMSTLSWTTESGNLTGLGRVCPPMVVNVIILTWSWEANVLELGVRATLPPSMLFADGMLPAKGICSVYT